MKERPTTRHSAWRNVYRGYPRRGGRTTVCALTLVLVVFSIGCQKRDATIAGITIPVPAEMTAIPDKVFEPIKGLEDGQVSYRGNVSPEDIFRFYQENMEARGWAPTTFMVSKKEQMAYTKGDRICLVWYTANADGTTTLTIMIGTSQPPA